VTSLDDRTAFTSLLTVPFVVAHVEARYRRLQTRNGELTYHLLGHTVEPDTSCCCRALKRILRQVRHATLERCVSCYLATKRRQS
jgi:hypothetical protein